MWPMVALAESGERSRGRASEEETVATGATLDQANGDQAKESRRSLATGKSVDVSSLEHQGA